MPCNISHRQRRQRRAGATTSVGREAIATLRHYTEDFSESGSLRVHWFLVLEVQSCGNVIRNCTAHCHAKLHMLCVGPILRWGLGCGFAGFRSNYQRHRDNAVEHRLTRRPRQRQRLRLPRTRQVFRVPLVEERCCGLAVVCVQLNPWPYRIASITEGQANPGALKSVI